MFTWFIFLVLDLVLYLCFLGLSTMVPIFLSFHFWDNMGMCFWCSLFDCANICFWRFPVSGCTCLNFTWLGFLIVFFGFHLLYFLWICLLYWNPWRFCMGDWTLYLVGFFNWVFCLVCLLDFLLVCLLSWLPGSL